MTIPNKCKMHDGAHDYAKHDCGHEYCPVYWSSCPRCHGREIANMVKPMKQYVTFGSLKIGETFALMFRTSAVYRKISTGDVNNAVLIFRGHEHLRTFGTTEEVVILVTR